MQISAQTTRVAVVDGHTEAISVEFETAPPEDEILAAWSGFAGEPRIRELPTAPEHPIVYLGEPNRPQPRLDVGRERGMAVTIGRLRRCPVLHYKFVALGHNTVRGAAGAAVLNGELLAAEGWLD
jgi:aspartate-semialdehyde dehydrogenase